jgi:hypothetical protein
MVEDGRVPVEVHEPFVVRTHVTPWGFAVALPLALGFAYLGAWAFDADVVPHKLGIMEEPPIWLFGTMFVGFALFLFLIGVGELASYLKPGVEVVMDATGIATHGIIGQRRIAWDDLLEARIDSRQIELAGRTSSGGSARRLRLHFNRLEVEPAQLLASIRARRPDLALVHASGSAS